MNRMESFTVATLAGPIASSALNDLVFGTRYGTAIHEAAHCIVAVRLGLEPSRVRLFDAGGGVTEYSTDAHTAPALSDAEVVRVVAVLNAPDGRPEDHENWIQEMERRAEGLVNKHWRRILHLADQLEERGSLTREEIVAASKIRNSEKGNLDCLGPSGANCKRVDPLHARPTQNPQKGYTNVTNAKERTNE